MFIYWNYIYWLLLFLIRIKFWYAQISVPKIGISMLKMACDNPCVPHYTYTISFYVLDSMFVLWFLVLFLKI